MNDVLFVLLLLTLIVALAVCRDNGQLREELRIERARRSQPWDWTREDEERVQAALELICDKCHEPFRCGEDELVETCSLCPVPDVIYRIVKEKRIAAAQAAPRKGGEEARG